jgi:3-deoxy-D-manno-octulosonic-acid transferase
MNFWPLYGMAARVATPLIRGTLAYRAAAGKEDPKRLQERWGVSARARPDGPLVWFHAASVGESLSLMKLLDLVLQARPEMCAVVTTVTMTSAAVLAERLPAGRAWHQYSPVDHPRAIRQFLDHWRPDLAVWVESELWPNLVLATRARGIRMALVNARLSERSSRGWKRVPQHAEALVRSFDLILAQDQAQALRWRDLGAEHADSVGNLKADPAEAPRTDLAARLGQKFRSRPRWLAASTHVAEEAAVIEAHLLARTRHPGLLTILAPRHPARADAVAALVQGAGLTLARRALGELPEADTDVWLIDTLGELGAVYPMVPIILIAGSFGAPGSLGGHNPADAASCGAALLFGPDMANSAELADKLLRAKAAIRVDAAGALGTVLSELLSDPGTVDRMGAAAATVAEGERGVSQATFARLEPLLPPAGSSVSRLAGA